MFYPGGGNTDPEAPTKGLPCSEGLALSSPISNITAL